MYFDDMDFKPSPSSSASSSPISIGWPSASSASSSYSSRSASSFSSQSQSMTCAYPSWTGFSPSATPNAFISDEDLFPDELLDGASPLLLEAPAPPRDIPLPTAMPMPLAPLYASEKKKSRRRSSKTKKRASPSHKLTPISESPEVSE